MKHDVILILLAVLITERFSHSSGTTRDCDKATAEKIIESKEFNKIAKYDDAKSFNSFSAAENKTLWFKEIESPKQTKFTSLWDDYDANNYHTSHLGFVDYYETREDVDLAFQFGPMGFLWAYDIFVFKKVGDCYLGTRSYFRHNRFIEKKYALLGKRELDSLFTAIGRLKTLAAGGSVPLVESGYFRNNRNKTSFYTESEPDIKEIYSFIDDRIKWIKTYSL